MTRTVDRRVDIALGVVVLALVALNALLASWYGRGIGRLPLAVERRVDLFSLPSEVSAPVVDPVHDRIFVAATDAGTIVSFDAQSLAERGSASGIDQARMLTVAPADDRLFAYSPTTREIVSVIEHEPAIAARATFDGVTAMAFDDGGDHLLATLTDGRLEIVDPRTLRSLDTIVLDGRPGGIAIDASTHRAFVSLGGTRELAAVDLDRRSVVATVPLGGCIGAGPIAFDPLRHRVYVGCTAIGTVLAVDLATGAVVDRAFMPFRTLQLALDARASRLFASSYSGMVAAFDLGPPLRRVGQDVFGKRFEGLAALPGTDALVIPQTGVAHVPKLVLVRVGE